MTKLVTVHIRRRSRPLRGSQFYRDRGERRAETFCGAELGAYDANWNAKVFAWTRSDGVSFKPCVDCVASRRAAGPLRKNNPKIQVGA